MAKVTGFDELVAQGQDTVEGGGFLVQWVDIGEGNSGDYNPDDPDDVALLRFDIMRRDEDGEWGQVQDGSYCTQMPVDTPAPLLRKALEHILAQIMKAGSVKRRAEELSWIGPASKLD